MATGEHRKITMETSIKQICDGAFFLINFKKIIVEKCSYINAINENVETIPILTNAEATIMRFAYKSSIQIKIFDHTLNLEMPFAQFRVTTASYHCNEHSEVCQTPLVRGNEIIEEYPVTHSGLKKGNISLFMISKQNNKIIAFILLNPKDSEDFYYRIIFSES